MIVRVTSHANSGAVLLVATKQEAAKLFRVGITTERATRRAQCEYLNSAEMLVLVMEAAIAATD